MMTVGGMYLRARLRLRGGARAAYWREVVRPRILATGPVPVGGDAGCEVHVMTSAQDWVDMVWALKSFFCHSGRSYGLCIHDDGSLGPSRISALATHFPGGRVVGRAEADQAVLPTLEAYPKSLAFRKSNHLAPKVFDFAHFLTTERMLLLDSDVLFFANPTELVRRVENSAYRKNSVNGDVDSAYTVDPEAVRAYTNVTLVPRFNSGLGLIHRASLNLDWIEEFLALPGILSHFWRIEQTIYALCSSRFGCELLPAEYDVRLTGSSDGLPCRHYVGAIRQQLYKEGIRRLVRSGFLKQLARRG